MTRLKYTQGSDNIFVDLGFSEQEAEELLLKSHLFHRLQDAIRDSKTTQAEIAQLLGTDQSKVSKILRGKMSDFSIDRITSYLLKLRWDLRIDASPAPAKAKRGRVVLGGISKNARAAKVAASAKTRRRA